MATENQHKPNSFTPVVKAMYLADYTINITNNTNKFPDYSTKDKKNEDGTIRQLVVFRDDSLTNRVRALSHDIFMLTYTANEINVNKQPYRKQERLDKQALAIQKCNELLADLQLCRIHFHLSNKKVLYWGRQVRDLRIAIEGWHETDKARYKNI